MLERLNGGTPWHLDPRVSIALFGMLLTVIGAIVGQTAYIVSWGAKIDARVESLEKSRIEFHVRYDAEQSAQNQRLNKLEDIYPRLSVVENNQQIVLKRLDTVTEKLDRLLELR